jgi:predicted metal-dependent phosphoesterase TrpH
VSKVDLHVHSTASDGRYSPADIVHKAIEHGLTVIAISDHDSVDGITPALNAAEAFPWFRVIPCVEISTDVSQGEAHVLGYFIDYTDQDLLVTLDRMRNSRRERAQGMIAKLENLGIQLEWQRVQEIAGGGSIGRPHLAQAMLEKGYITSLKEAFTNYISRSGPAYVERKKMTPVEAVELILQAGGLPVLAHPTTVNNPEMTIVTLKAAGLIGIETYYAGHTDKEVNKLIGLANKYGLITTGGSDYHGLDADNDTMLGDIDVPLEAAELLITLAKQRGLKFTNL